MGIKVMGEYLKAKGPVDASKFAPLGNIWKSVAPYVANGHLRTMFIECAYPNGRPPHILFGHLTPDLLVAELVDLQEIVAREKQFQKGKVINIDVVVMHIKPTFATNEKDGRKAGDGEYPEKEDKNTVDLIKGQLTAAWAKEKDNILNVNFVYLDTTDILYVKHGMDMDYTADKAPNGKADVLPYSYFGYGLRDVYNDYPSLRGPGHGGSVGSGSYVMEEVAVLFGALMIVLCSLCFVFGIVFGAGIPAWKRWREENEKKRLN